MTETYETWKVSAGTAFTEKNSVPASVIPEKVWRTAYLKPGSPGPEAGTAAAEAWYWNNVKRPKSKRRR